MRTSKGLSTEAVYIFNNMLRKLAKQFEPAYVAAIFESGEPTHRTQEFAEYKANRAETPPDLLEQIPLVRRVLEAMRIPILQYPGFEADDVIGTLARTAEREGFEVVIVSSDKDLLQLVSDKVSMLNPAKDDEWYDPKKVKEFMGVRPDQVADLLALKGDAIDNIPGAPGIGDKGARDLIEQFGSVEAALERAAEVQRKMYRESLQNNVDRIRMSKRLATVAIDVPVPFDAASVKAQPFDAAALKAIYKELEFHSLLKELEPGEDSRTRDYRVIAGPEELAEWLEKGGGPAARRGHLEIGGGRVRARYHRAGADPGGSARSHLGKPALPEAVARRRRAAEDRVRRQMGAADARPHGDRSARVHPRRDALRVPAGCGPVGMSARRAGAAPAGPETGSVARAARRYRARDLGPALRRRWIRAACATCTKRSSCRWRGCWRGWSAPACGSTRSS